MTTGRHAAPSTRFVDDSTRREFVAGGLTLGALVLAGCGDAEDRAGAPGGDAGFPVTVDHKYGTTRIPSRPRRIVALGGADHDPVLALGVTPVMVARLFKPPTFHPWNADRVGRPRPVEHPPIVGGDIEFELVAAQRPDLILSLQSDLDRKGYETLSRIAPTIAPDGRFAPFATPWPTLTRVVGRALGREREADELIAAAQRRLADVRREQPDLAGTTIAIASANPGSVGLTPPDSVRYAMFESLGMTPASAMLDPGSQDFRSLSLERLDVLDDADVVAWIGPGRQREILEQPTYRAQAVHRQGRELFPPVAIAPAIAFPSVLSLPYAAERLAGGLAAAADREPA